MKYSHVDIMFFVKVETVGVEAFKDSVTFRHLPTPPDLKVISAEVNIKTPASCSAWSTDLLTPLTSIIHH